MGKGQILKAFEQSGKVAPELIESGALQKAVEYQYSVNPPPEFFETPGKLFDNLPNDWRVETIQLAGQFQELIEQNNSEAQEQKEVAIDFGTTTPDSQLTVYQLLERIQSDVKAIRQQFFNSATPPFSDSAEAISWIERQSQQDIDKQTSTGKERKNAYQRMKAIANEYGLEFTPSNVNIPINPSEQGSGPDKRYLTVKNSHLRKLYNETEALANKTGLRHGDIVRYVLTGIEPTLPRLQIVATVGTNQMPEVTITLKSQDVKYDELWTAFKSYRNIMNIKQKERKEESDLRLFQLVQELGGLPSNNKMEFWEKVKSEWNRRYGVNPDYTTYKNEYGPMMRYRRRFL